MASVHEPVGFLDIEAAKARYRRDRASIVGGQVEDRAQRVHVVLEIKSHGHATIVDRGIGLISRIVERFSGEARRFDVCRDDVADHNVHERIELRLDCGQSLVVHVSPFPLSCTEPDSAMREGGQ